MARPAGLILDYGNVLSRPQDQTWFGPAAERIGASPEALHSAYWRYRHHYDAALPVEQYWRRVLAAARPGRDGAISDGDLAWLIERDIASWAVYHDEVWALAAERAAGAPRSYPTAAPR